MSTRAPGKWLTAFLFFLLCFILSLNILGVCCCVRVNEVDGTGFSRGDKDSVNRFADCLNSSGVVATVRRRLGSDVNAACGQLRRKKKEENKENEEN